MDVNEEVLFAETEWFVKCLCYVVCALGTIYWISSNPKHPAPFGRYYTDGKLTDKLMLTKINFTIPARLFWIIMESPNLVMVLLTLFYFYPKEKLNVCNMILLGMFSTHYVYRAWIYPLIQTTKPGTFLAFIAALAFCSTNGYTQAVSLMYLYKYDDNWMRSANFIIGVILFVFGLSTNIYSDRILQNLRKPGETGYKTPKGPLIIFVGGMFEYVSCANYFGEIVEWSGFALACWSFPAFTFAWFTASNLIPRALSHHQYYLEKMDDYPKNRKAVIPYLL